MSFDVAKWNKKRYLAEAELQEKAKLDREESLNEIEKEYKWKEAPRNKYSDPNVVNKKEMLSQIGNALDDLQKLTLEKGKYITPTQGGATQTAEVDTIVGQFLSKQVRDFVDKYEKDLEGIKILDRNGYATFEPIWKGEAPKGISGPDPRGMSLD
jgi:ribosomal protein S4